MRPAVRRQPRQGRQIGHGQQRVGDGLGVQNVCLGRQPLGQQGIQRSVDHLHAPGHQVGVHELLRGAVERQRAHQPLARPQQPEQHAGDNAHARGSGDGVLGPLQLGHRPLPGHHGGIAGAAVAVEALLAVQGPRHQVQAGGLEHRGLVEGRHQRRRLPRLGALAGVNASGGEGIGGQSRRAGVSHGSGDCSPAPGRGKPERLHPRSWRHLQSLPGGGNGNIDLR